MKNRSLRHLFMPLKNTPFHPQWLVFRNHKQNLAEIGAKVGKDILDIGSGRQTIRRYLLNDCRYLSLDYYQTSTNWYQVQPDVYGDGQRLPFSSGSFDTVLLLDVLEHLPYPDYCLHEVHRVLRPGGSLIIQVPFLYPLHDEPFDFQRWTIYGLRTAARRHNFTVEEEVVFGTSLETAALLSNLALSKTVLSSLQQRHPLAILTLILPGFILCTNLAGWLFSHFGISKNFMPQEYRMIWKKES